MRARAGRRCVPAARHRAMHRTAFYRVPELTARLIPCTEWHLDDVSVKDHRLRCLVTSALALAKGAAHLATEAAAQNAFRTARVKLAQERSELAQTLADASAKPSQDA